MTTEEMKSLVNHRLNGVQVTLDKMQFIYGKTIDMLDAIEDGKDKAMCLEYWTTLFDKMDGSLKEDKEYYLAHMLGLTRLIDDWAKEEVK